MVSQKTADHTPRKAEDLVNLPLPLQPGQAPHPPLSPLAGANAARGGPRQLQAPTHVQHAPAQRPRSGPGSPDLARAPASALRRRVTQTLPSSRRRTSARRGLSLAELLLAAASSTGRARPPPDGASSPLRPSSPQQASPDSSLPPRDSSLHSSPARARAGRHGHRQLQATSMQ